MDDSPPEPVYPNLLPAIGRTPMVELARVRRKGNGVVLAKCEQ